jgi:phosphate starvation-inducible protein PhoH and related proteins
MIKDVYLARGALRERLETDSIEFQLAPDDNRRLLSLCGRFDEHLRLIENRLGVEIHSRGSSFMLKGPKTSIVAAKSLILQLYKDTEAKEELTPHQIHLGLQQLNAQDAALKTAQDAQEVVFQIPVKRGVVKPRTANQQNYLKNLQSFDINFGIGPAGTGKTFLAVASAIYALETEAVRRILLVRPAVEAGERLGFLPGDLAQKIDPYLRPLFDALHDMMGYEKASKLLERNIIEIAPLAYMRGRTLNDAFVILDEGQNTTVDQMKMFLTRIGFSSKAVITGDPTQIDLPRGERSGLKHAIEVLAEVKGIKFNYFESKDVVRHPLVQRIVDAYAAFENKKK